MESFQRSQKFKYGERVISHATLVTDRLTFIINRLMFLIQFITLKLNADGRLNALVMRLRKEHKEISDLNRIEEPFIIEKLNFLLQFEYDFWIYANQNNLVDLFNESFNEIKEGWR